MSIKANDIKKLFIRTKEIAKDFFYKRKKFSYYHKNITQKYNILKIVSNYSLDLYNFEKFIPLVYKLPQNSLIELIKWMNMGRYHRCLLFISILIYYDTKKSGEKMEIRKYGKYGIEVNNCDIFILKPFESHNFRYFSVN